MSPQTLLSFTHSDDFVLKGLPIEKRVELTTLYNCVRVDAFMEQITGLQFPGMANVGESPVDFQLRQRAYLGIFFQNLGSKESQNFSSRGNQEFRGQLLNEPLFRGIEYLTGVPTVDINASRYFPPQQTTNSNRQRGFAHACVSALYIAFACLASDSAARDRINIRAMGFKIPKVFKQLLNSTRRSIANNVRITPMYVGLTNSFLTSNSLKNTILDIDYMCTETGISRLFSLFSLLADLPDCYIPMDVLDKPIPFESGFTTTAMAVALEEQPVKTQSKVFQVENTNLKLSSTAFFEFNTLNSENRCVLLPGHSYGDSVQSAHVYDSTVQCRRINDVSGSAVTIGFFSVSIYALEDNTGYSNYVALRMASILHNDFNRKPPSNGDDSKGNRTPFRQMRGGKPPKKQISDAIPEAKDTTTSGFTNSIIGGIIKALRPILNLDKAGIRSLRSNLYKSLNRRSFSTKGV